MAYNYWHGGETSKEKGMKSKLRRVKGCFLKGQRGKSERFKERNVRALMKENNWKDGMEMRNASVSVRSIDRACYDRKTSKPKTEKLKIRSGESYLRRG